MKKAPNILCAFFATCVFSWLTSCEADDAINARATKTNREHLPGVWAGKSNCNPYFIDSVVFGPSTSPDTFINTGYIGNKNTICYKKLAMKIVVHGDSIIMPTQKFMDNCGLEYTFSAYGQMNGDSLKITEFMTGAINVVCELKLKKKAGS